MAATWGFGVWNGNAWGSDNNINAVDGISASFSLGSVTVDAELNSGWGRLTWGENAWGEQGDVVLSGISMSASLGDEVISIDVNPIPTGIPLTAFEGTAEEIIAVEVPVTGINLTSNLGTADAGPDAMLTGNQATMGLGTVEAFNLTGWGRLGWSINDWGDAGSSIQVDVSGIAMTAALGSPTEITGDATIVANTLNVAQLTLGQVDPAPDAAVTGNFMIGALGTLGFQGDVAPTVTGFGLSAALGNETVDLNQQVNVTGNPLLARVASVSAFTDATATFNGFGLTTTVGSGNALIWNDINTGSAPIDPPGWREVVA